MKGVRSGESTLMTSRPPRILFRADALPELGGGHIMRCLSLANALSNRGTDIVFACAPGSADLVPALARSGYRVLEAARPADIPKISDWDTGPDAIFVDLYTSTIADERAFREISPVIAVIEDLPDRQHDCDLLIDQGFDRDEAEYRKRVLPHTTLMLGPDMVPLRPDFAEKRDTTLTRFLDIERPQSLLIAMGLTDIDGISAKMARAARSALPEAHIKVIIGPSATSRDALQFMAQTDTQLEILIDVHDMATQMATADLAIGAGGGTALERCVLGLPSIVIVLADNQQPAALAMQACGAAIVGEAGPNIELEVMAILHAITGDQLRQMSKRAAELCDGRGAERIATSLLQLVASRQ
jgi:UDP-2,4-diacetamido-2,4,6-trideoxy-beta-L-altropyranose hydrolase